MSADPIDLSESDLDLLIDYTAGALTGVEQHRVERLIRADERWADAHATLLAADAAVMASLGALPATGPMPADIAARLDAVLAEVAAFPALPAEFGPTGSAGGATVLSLPSDRSSSTYRSSPKDRSLSTGRTRRAVRTDRTRRRRLVMTVAGIAAAAVAIVGGVTVAINLAPRNVSTSTAAGSANRDAQSPTLAQPPGLSADASAPQTMVSGLDYQPDTLGQLAKSDRSAAPSPAPVAGSGAGQPERAPDLTKGVTPGPLARLSDPQALAECLAAIGRVHAGSPRLVDFASFEGRPAVLVLLRQDAIATVVVVGPACGRDSADERYAANVG